MKGMEQQFEPEKRLNSEAQNIPPLPQEEAAEFLLEQSGNAETAALSALLQQEVKDRRKEERATVAWAGVFLASMLWQANRNTLEIVSLQQNLLFCAALMLLLGGNLCVQMRLRSTRRVRLLKQGISQVENKTQVSTLIRTLRTQNTSVRSLAKQALTAMLPTLQASDAILLGTEERKILLHYLAISPNDPGYRDIRELFSPAAYRRELYLRIAMLKALEQVGGAQELVVVERLARGVPTLQSAIRIPQEIQEAAKECLPFLQQRVGEQRASAELLRASSEPATSENMLLRPVASYSEERPEQLLRASQNRL